jgi:hypothetical protein
VEFAMNAGYPHRHHLSAKVRSFIDLLAHHSAGDQKLINPIPDSDCRKEGARRLDRIAAMQ